MVGMHVLHVCTICPLWAVITFSESFYQPLLLSVIIIVALTALHIFLQSWSPIAKAASLKATDLKADPPAACCASSRRAGGEAKARKAVMHCKATIRLCFTGEETETDGEQVNCSKWYE